MIDLDKKSLTMVKAILAQYLPHIPVKAFGSRVTGKAKRYSDLDLVICDDKPTPIKTINELKFAFSNSDLPIMVDVVDWHTISTAFRDIIQNDCVLLTET